MTPERRPSNGSVAREPAHGGFAERRLDLRKLERKLEIPRTPRVMPNELYKLRTFISYAHPRRGRPGVEEGSFPFVDKDAARG
jgi:hypothetical protein